MLRARFAVCAALAFNPALGSLYAWSVYLGPLERELGVARAELSVVFSAAVVAFALAMTCAPAAYRLAPPALLILASGLACAAGLALAALATDVALLALGYGVLFGAGNGFGYSVALQCLNLALSRRRGLANGFGIGLFAAGSALCAPLFAAASGVWGAPATLAATATAFLAVTAVAALCLHLAGLDLTAAGSLRAPHGQAAPPRLFALLWFGFFLGAAAGLMALSQAAGLIVAYGGGAALAVAGTAFVGIGNGLGRLAGGWLCDHRPIRAVAMAAHAVAALGLGPLLFWPGPWVAAVAVVLVGLSYGLLSGAYPAALGYYYGVESFGRMIGRLITAWGVAGLLAPALAGLAYDRTGGYEVAVALALACVLAAVLIANRLPPRPGDAP